MTYLTRSTCFRIAAVVAALALAALAGVIVSGMERLPRVAPTAWAGCAHFGGAAVCVQATWGGVPTRPSVVQYVVRCPPADR